jgi:hypothetical protein
MEVGCQLLGRPFYWIGDRMGVRASLATVENSLAEYSRRLRIKEGSFSIGGGGENDGDILNLYQNRKSFIFVNDKDKLGTTTHYRL